MWKKVWVIFDDNQVESHEVPTKNLCMIEVNIDHTTTRLNGDSIEISDELYHQLKTIESTL